MARWFFPVSTVQESLPSSRLRLFPSWRVACAIGQAYLLQKSRRSAVAIVSGGRFGRGGEKLAATGKRGGKYCRRVRHRKGIIMSVSSVNLDPSIASSSWRSTVQQATQDFNQLFQSLQSGNVDSAQQAYSSIQQIQAALQQNASGQTSASTASTASNPVASDWSALGQALQSGSLSSAQSALNQLQQDAQSAWQTHLQQEVQNAQSVYSLLQGGGAASTGATAQAGSAPGTSSVQSDLNSLSQALQSGNTSSAQQALAQLEQDLQSSGQASGQGYGGHHHHHHGGFSNTNASSAYGSATTASLASTPAAMYGTAGITGTSATV
jgi:hypothetical protein